jgi:hypothetical protein
MKNSLNNISQEEKNRILEMHSGKKNVISEQPEHGMGAIINEPKKNDFVNQNMLRPVLEKLGYNQVKSLDGGWTKMIPQKNITLSIHFNNGYAVVETKNINQPTQTDSYGKIHGMGELKPSEKFPLNMRSNILNDFARFLKDCEK